MLKNYKKIAIADCDVRCVRTNTYYINTNTDFEIKEAIVFFEYGNTSANAPVAASTRNFDTRKAFYTEGFTYYFALSVKNYNQIEIRLGPATTAVALIAKRWIAFG